jgi:DNA-binding CsgD family transcriptional regulator
VGGRRLPQHGGDASVEAVHGIYQCVLRTEEWPAALARLTERFHATYSLLLTRSRLDGAVRITEIDRLPTAEQRAYEQYFSALLPRTRFIDGDAFASGQMTTDGAYEDYGAYLRSELYNDFFRRLAADHMLFVPLHRSPLTDTAFVMRRSRAVGPFEAADLRQFAPFAAHLACAARLIATEQEADNRVRNADALFGGGTIAAFVVDGSGRILHRTQAAARMPPRPGIFVISDGDPLPLFAAGAGDLRAALRACIAASARGEFAFRRALRSGSAGDRPGPYDLVVRALPWHGPLGSRLPACLVIFHDRQSADALIAEQARAFDLTPAETRLAVALCAGRPVADHAQDARISVLTARTLLKRVLQKTDTHSQMELVGRLLRSAGSWPLPQGR